MLAASETTTSLDIATAVVAVYAAIVASMAFVFQVFQWTRTWQTRVEVKLARMMLHAVGANDEPVVLFTLTNHSGHDVKVTHVGLDPVRRGGPHMFIPHPLPMPMAGPVTIPARDSVTVYVKPEVIGASEHDLSWKTRGKITTSDGRTFRSSRVRVRDLVTDTD